MSGPIKPANRGSNLAARPRELDVPPSPEIEVEVEVSPPTIWEPKKPTKPAPKLESKPNEKAVDGNVAVGDDPPVRPLLDMVTSTLAFAHLKPERQAKLLRWAAGMSLLGKPDLGQDLRQCLESAAFRNATPVEQGQRLEEWLAKQPGPADLTASKAWINRARAPYRIEGPSEVSPRQFPGVTAPGVEYTVTVGTQSIKVILAEPPPQDRLAYSIDQIAKAFAGLPAALRREVGRVRQSPTTNPADDTWRRDFGQPAFKSAMAAGYEQTIEVFAIDKAWQHQSLLDAGIIHETAHFFHRPGGTGPASFDFSKWEAAMKRDEISPSTYARMNPDEDFSETVSFYVMVKGTRTEVAAKLLFPERWRILEALFPDTSVSSL